MLLLASVVSAIWALSLTLQALGAVLNFNFFFILETARYWAWLVFLVSVLNSAGRQVLGPLLRFAAVGTPVALIVVGLLPIDSIPGSLDIYVPGSIFLCMIGFALVERVFAGSDRGARSSPTFLSVAMVGIFGFDLVLLSLSVLSEGIEPGLWAARGVANAVVVPFIVVASRKQRNWSVDLFVSRHVAYFSATLVGAGIYLLLMAIGVYYVKQLGGDWGDAAGAVVMFGAIVLLLALLMSHRFRRSAKVFFSKHFFSNRYDYREEWQNLTQALYHPDQPGSLGERSIQAAARIFSSESGFILLKSAEIDSTLAPHAVWRTNIDDDCTLQITDPLPRYLERSTWVVDTYEHREEPSVYDNLELPGWLSDERQQLVVPLLEKSDLIGILVLMQSSPIKLNYEDRDLLKIVGRQVAGVLEQDRASERLAEGKQFEAYSRLTAFLMHDLKNLAAQQSLVVKNAAAHKRNPDFVDDAFKTIEHSVNRMNRLIAQLGERDRKLQRQRLDLSKILAAAVERTRDRRPRPSLVGAKGAMHVRADRDRLFSVFQHVLRNAQDATDDDGKIRVEMSLDNGLAVVNISDTGIGMDDTFIRERLFRPFESTKGVDGMGIGAYQAREYLRQINGRLHVESEPGQGTRVTIVLPID
jgi:putative PEP-CTERM system histidine kinase